jgi:hypothetical protein
MQTTVKRATVIEKGGKYWGVQYEDGHSTTYGYGPIENASFHDRRYCKRPEDATYRGSYLIPKLREGRLLDVKITTTVEPDFSIHDIGVG